jgi:hypothetical protein
LLRGWRGERRVWGFGGNLRKRENWGDPGVGGRIIFRWIFRKWDEGVWTGLDLLITNNDAPQSVGLL